MVVNWLDLAERHSVESGDRRLLARWSNSTFVSTSSLIIRQRIMANINTVDINHLKHGEVNLGVRVAP